MSVEKEKTMAYKFKLVSVINGPICLTQLDQCIEERGKKKPFVSITPCDDNNQIKITHHGKQDADKLPAHPIDICSILQTKIQTRALSLTVQTPYTINNSFSIVLIAKKSTKKYLDELYFILRSRINKVQTQMVDCKANSIPDATEVVTSLQHSMSISLPLSCHDVSVQQSRLVTAHPFSPASTSMTWCHTTGEIKTLVFQFKLISILTGDLPLSIAEFEKSVTKRDKNKDLVIVTMSNGLLRVEHDRLQLLISDLTDVCCVLKTAHKPRAIGFSVHQTNGCNRNVYSSVILISPKNQSKCKVSFYYSLQAEIAAAQKMSRVDNISAVTPPLTSNISAATPPLTSDISAATPPLTSDISAVTPPLTSDISAVTPPLTSDISAVTPPLTSDISAVTPPLTSDKNFGPSSLLGLPNCGNVPQIEQKQSPYCSPVLIANDAVVNTAKRKPENFLFKLVSVLEGDVPLSPALLKKSIILRVRRKSIVTAILCNGLLNIYCGKPDHQIAISPVTDVCCVLRDSYEPRAIGVSMHNPSSFGCAYLSIILISKKGLWPHKDKFYSILKSEIELARRSRFEVNISAPISFEVRTPVAVENSLSETNFFTSPLLECPSIEYPSSGAELSPNSASSLCDTKGAEEVGYAFSGNTFSGDGGSASYGSGGSGDSGSGGGGNGGGTSDNTIIIHISSFELDDGGEDTCNSCCDGGGSGNVDDDDADADADEGSDGRDCGCSGGGDKHGVGGDGHGGHAGGDGDGNITTMSIKVNKAESDETFKLKVAVLQSMHMLVALDSNDGVAECSRSDTFEYIALHVENPSLDCLSCPYDYQLLSPKMRDIPEQGISSVVIDFQPEFDMSDEDHIEKVWFSKSRKTAIIVAHSRNNGLQRFPTFPTLSFIERMATLFKAYLKPRMYKERNLGITNDPDKIAKYLAANEHDSYEDILSYQDARLSEYWYNPPCSIREPLVKDVDSNSMSQYSIINR